MSKVLVLYHSTYGHIETMAQAVAEGARSTGATVDIKRVPELVPAIPLAEAFAKEPALKAAAEDYLRAAFRMERYGDGDERS